jgi:glycosyltransferase involved in cell wall biosynthesis
LSEVQLSIIIATRDRPERLAACLKTLRAQDAAAGDLEVIVVDDGSSEPVQRRLAAALDSPRPRFVWQEPAGLNAARNTGAAASSGEVLAFLDDDTLVDPGWAHAVATAFHDTGCDALGGRINLLMEDAAPRWMTPRLRRYLAEFELGDQPDWITAEPVPVGANCAVRRSTFDVLGGFAAGLDRVGTSLISNGDTEFFRRLQRAGGTIRYEPRASVRHCVPATRLSRDFFQRRAHAQGLSDALLDIRLQRRVVPMREYVRAGRSLAIAGKGLLAGGGLTGGRIWLEYCKGRLSANCHDSQPR